MSAAMNAVANATADVPRLYALGAVPDGPKYPYGSYSATLGRGDTYTLSGEGVRWGRVVVQTFGKTAATALSLAESVRSDLVGTRLGIEGYETSPCRAELDPTVIRDPDGEGLIAVTATYDFTATRRASP